MASFGRLSNSMLSATIENTLALVNINFDFSVFRVDPSEEYAPIGLALTNTRRQEAESGTIHATACQLGFLFHQLLPNTPRLLYSYGKRTSEILARPDINPEGTENDGPFQGFIGADCTSVWAAATCGPASVGVSLLASMLSRAWGSKEAISIWSELVEERQRQIRAQIQANEIVHPHTKAAANRKMARSELAEWDASARSWLRRADLFMEFNHQQLRLIADNLTIPYSTGGSTFEKVTMAWINSMEVMEKLLCNHPQEACDRAVLLAVSSWHLYPDLLVFQQEAKKIVFKDSLVPSAGVLSLGLEYKGPSKNMTKWSLALSHLRYYGDPVSVSSHEDHSRVRFQQLWLVVLGAVFRQWNVSYANFDLAVDWCRDLHAVVASAGAATDFPELSWIVKLCSAPADVYDTNQATRLIKYGWRRGTKLLGNAEMAMHSPYFGLLNPHVIDAMKEATDVDCGISYLRGMASHASIGNRQGIISYSGTLDQNITYTEWATTTPVEVSMWQWAGHSYLEEATRKSTPKHIRWICLHGKEKETSHLELLKKRGREISNGGEICYLADEDDLPKFVKRNDFKWRHPPLVFHRAPEELSFVPLHRLRSWKDDGFNSFHLHLDLRGYDKALILSYWNSYTSTAAIVAPLEQVKDCLRQSFQPRRVVQYLLASVTLTPSNQPGIKGFSNRNELKRKAPMDEHQLEEQNDTSGSETSARPFDATGAFSLMSSRCNKSKVWLMSLRVLEVAEELYKQLPKATVSLRLLEQDLLKAKWLPLPIRSILDDNNPMDSFINATKATASHFLEGMSRADAFACIAMFESGQFNIDPEQLNEVVALCCEDSIFVAGRLLSDPSTKSQGAHIRHLVGNIGHPGMVLLVSPLEPRIRPLKHDAQLVEHQPYDGKYDNRFRGTSLHLSFTTWKMALDWHNTGEIDQEIFLLESVVAVQDNGNWIADIDVIEIEKGGTDVIEQFNCTEECASKALDHSDVVSIDCWEELLDPPPCTGVFRARGNWAARLAVASILAQQGKGHAAVVIGSESICWHCLRVLYAEPELHVPQIIIF
ncbi:hypothetical protein S7711_01846 [Stachybotrys chartarum IBT 7711]|uniref:Uncharacterized protein n=1 Tax=Stachybotrys chartarum (strain CBS 109288 / IBT 7711) TaxID=1280523 RepID=A0A084AJ56_STACB|nr:hypothetical protein S7711_01846 [Stachybotrys chartarum IBT 7711]